MLRYFIGFVVTIGLIVLLIVLLLSGGSKPSHIKPLGSYAGTNAQVRMTIAGPINAAQSHQQVQITVDQYQATFDEFSGYDGDIVNSKSYPNTQNAYASFLLALQYAGYTKGNTSPSLRDDRGYCPLGNRYIFELMQNGSDLQRFWTTSCGSPKTYNGNANLTITLFQAQIPDYSTLTQNLSL